MYILFWCSLRSLSRLRSWRGGRDSNPPSTVLRFFNREEPNLIQISNAISDHHKNFILDDINDHCLRMAVMEDKTFPWHSHPDSDELFLIVEGELTIEFTENQAVTLRPGEFLKVPAGQFHRTIAKGRTVNLCFESIAAETIFVESLDRK